MQALRNWDVELRGPAVIRESLAVGIGVKAARLIGEAVTFRVREVVEARGDDARAALKKVAPRWDTRLTLGEALSALEAFDSRCLIAPQRNVITSPLRAAMCGMYKKRRRYAHGDDPLGVREAAALIFDGMTVLGSELFTLSLN